MSRPRGERRARSHGAITRDVSQGRKSYAARGALIGTGIGLIIGAAVVATADWDGWRRGSGTD